MKHPIYLDYAATTPCDEVVFEEMTPYFTKDFGNPSSLHKYGQIAAESLSVARERIQNLINAEFDEIIFTCGSTDSNRIAIERVVTKLSKTGKNHFITIKTDHKSVLDEAAYLKSIGMEVTLLDVGSDGLIDLDNLMQSIKENTALVSICFVNNETGVIQDIKKIAKICHEKGALIHTDATQAMGKVPLDIKDLDIDFLSASGHKLYGPKGIGLLFCRKSCQKLVKVQNANNEVEFGIRAGTVPTPLCIGFGKACEIAYEEMTINLEKIYKLRDKLISGIISQLDEVYLNGPLDNCYPGIINISFRGCEGEALMMEAKRIAVSSGSACTSNKLSISHVLDAMNIKTDIAQSSIRISIGKYTTEEDIDIAIEDLVVATKKLREMSPIWDMIKAGTDINSFFHGKEHS